MKEIKVCINKRNKGENYNNLTIGKSYIIDGEFFDFDNFKKIYMLNDGGFRWYFASSFITLKEYRRRKLEKIRNVQSRR